MRRQRRLPRSIEKELAKFLSTIGFSDYGTFLWDLATDNDLKSDPPRRINPAISRQIFQQAHHDPAVIAIGQEAVPFLRQQKRDLLHCGGIVALDLFGTNRSRPAAMLVAAHLDQDTSKNIARLIDALRRLGATSFLIVITDQPNGGETERAIGNSDDVHLVFWQDHYRGGAQLEARFFALFLHAQGAAVVVSLRSRLGLETIGAYGRALTPFHRFFAALGSQALGSSNLLTDVYYLRLIAPHAKVLAMSEAEAELLRSNSSGLVGPGIATLTDGQMASPDALRAIFGDSFDDQRSETSRDVITNLLGGRRQTEGDVEGAAVQAVHRSDIDITVTIIFHRERELAVPALASLFDMIKAARNGGLIIESRAILDNSDDLTRDLVTTRGQFLDDIREVSFGDPAMVRNAGVAMGQGRFLAFLDGDDLWGADWLVLSHRSATQAGAPLYAIWHPEAQLLFYASDCDRKSAEAPHKDVQTTLYLQQSSQAPDFEPRDLLLESLWSVNAFALREIYRRFPYRPNDWSRQIGIEDWRWNLDTLGRGVDHLIVPDTVHLIRIKEHGSLGQMHDANRLLPLLA